MATAPTFSHVVFMTRRFAIANLDVPKPDVPADSGQGEIGVNHVAYTYASAADLLETYARLCHNP